MNCAFENCVYGLYSADRFINSYIYGMVHKITNTEYMLLMSNSSHIITHSLFFGNSNRAIYFEKDVSVLSITDCVFDGLQPRAIMLNVLVQYLAQILL